jgi:exopolysaccharide biosynthesis protein
MAKFVQRTLTQTDVPGFASGRNIIAKWFECELSEMTIKSTGSTGNALNWPYYGTNASFYAPGTTTTSAIHVEGTTAVRTNSKNNCAAIGVLNTAMDYMWCKRQTSISTGTTAYVAGIQAKAAEWASHANSTSTIVESDTWAVGGFDLLVSTYQSSSANLRTAINAHFNVSPNPITNMVDSYVPAYSTRRARTAVGITSSNKIRFCVFYGSGSGTSPIDSDTGSYLGGPTVYEVHQIMHAFGCSKALLVDGGGSSKVHFKQGGTTNSATDLETGRNVLCILALTDSAANNCNWTATA